MQADDVAQTDEEQYKGDTGERVKVDHLKVFLAAILGFQLGAMAPEDTA